MEKPSQPSGEPELTEEEREAELLRLAKKAAQAEGTVPFEELTKLYEILHGEH